MSILRAFSRHTRTAGAAIAALAVIGAGSVAALAQQPASFATDSNSIITAKHVFDNPGSCPADAPRGRTEIWKNTRTASGWETTKIGTVGNIVEAMVYNPADGYIYAATGYSKGQGDCAPEIANYSFIKIAKDPALAAENQVVTTRLGAMPHGDQVLDAALVPVQGQPNYVFIKERSDMVTARPLTDIITPAWGGTHFTNSGEFAGESSHSAAQGMLYQDGTYWAMRSNSLVRAKTGDTITAQGIKMPGLVEASTVQVHELHKAELHDDAYSTPSSSLENENLQFVSGMMIRPGLFGFTEYQSGEFWQVAVDNYDAASDTTAYGDTGRLFTMYRGTPKLNAPEFAVIGTPLSGATDVATGVSMVAPAAPTNVAAETEQEFEFVASNPGNYISGEWAAENLPLTGGTYADGTPATWQIIGLSDIVETDRDSAVGAAKAGQYTAVTPRTSCTVTDGAAGAQLSCRGTHVTPGAKVKVRVKVKAVAPPAPPAPEPTVEPTTPEPTVEPEPTAPEPTSPAPVPTVEPEPTVEPTIDPTTPAPEPTTGPSTSPAPVPTAEPTTPAPVPTSGPTTPAPRPTRPAVPGTRLPATGAGGMAMLGLIAGGALAAGLVLRVRRNTRVNS